MECTGENIETFCQHRQHDKLIVVLEIVRMLRSLIWSCCSIHAETSIHFVLINWVEVDLLKAFMLKCTCSCYCTLCTHWKKVSCLVKQKNILFWLHRKNNACNDQTGVDCNFYKIGGRRKSINEYMQTTVLEANDPEVGHWLNLIEKHFNTFLQQKREKERKHKIFSLSPASYSQPVHKFWTIEQHHPSLATIHMFHQFIAHESNIY